MLIGFEQAAALLRQADDILILAHERPDGDALGSLFGLYFMLRDLGKRVRFVTDDVPQSLAFLCAENEAADFAPKTVVTVDVADKKLLGDALCARYGDRVDLAIDHHASHTPFAAHTLLDGKAAAASEVLYALFAFMGVPLTPEIALRLYTGIATDTGCFRYANVTPGTLRAAAALMETGIDAAGVNDAVFETKTPEYIAFERMALDSLRLFHGGKIAVMVLTLEMYRQANTSERDTQGVKALPRSVRGVLAGMTLKERAPGYYSVSVRSRDPFNALDLCRKFGGGGHKNAAGCELQGTAEQVCARLVAAAAEMIDGIGA